MNSYEYLSSATAFETIHLLWLFGGFSFGEWLSLIYGKMDKAGKKRMKTGLSVLCAALQLLRAALLLVRGEYGPAQLPLHLCNITVYLCLLHTLKPFPLLGQFLLAFSLPGLLLGLLFPGWRGYGAGDAVSILSFLLHILPAGYILMQRHTGELCPELKMLPGVCLAMLALALPVYIIDRLWELNFMFLNYPPEDTPLELFAFLGRPGYLLGMLPIAALIWLGLYGATAARKK